MSLRDKFYDLGPVVKPRDDKKVEPCSAGAGSRDDKFLRFIVLRFFFIVIPAQAGLHCTAGICVAFATA